MAELQLKKVYRCKGYKVDDRGKIKLVFGTMGVIDHDGDVTLPGAIGEAQKTRMSAYNHSSWGAAKPVGRGVIYESEKDMVYEGGFFMKTIDGLDTYETVKAMGDLQEYSYGFDILKASFGKFEDKEVRFLEELKIYEVSPVLLGAGIDTRTLAVKGQGGSSEEEDVHARAVRLYSAAAMKRIDKLILGSGEDTLTDEQILNGTLGLKAFDKAGNTVHVPEDAKSKTYAEHAEILLQAVEDFVKRSQSIADLREEKGKDSSSEQNHGRLLDIVEALNKAVSGLLDFVGDDEDEEANQQAALLLEEHDTRELLRGSTSGT